MDCSLKVIDTKEYFVRGTITENFLVGEG